VNFMFKLVLSPSAIFYRWAAKFYQLYRTFLCDGTLMERRMFIYFAIRR